MKLFNYTLPLVLVCGFFLFKSNILFPEHLAKGDQLRHIVLFKFTEDASQAQIEEVVAAFGNLENTIENVREFEWGTNNSPEGLDKGFTHCFLLTFKDEADRESYLPHADHKAFVELVGPIVSDVLVVDYFAQ